MEDTKPPTTLATARDLVSRLYPSIKLTKIKELVSYDDRNYLVTDEQDEQFVLKVTNSVDTANEGMLEGQNQLMLHLSNNHSLLVSYPIPNANSTYITRESFTKTGPKFAIRLLKFIPGTRLIEYQLNTTMLLQTGDLLGRLSSAINDGNFENPIIKTRTGLWSMESIPEIRKYLWALEDPQKKIWAEKVVGDFESRVLDRKREFPHAYIHGDFNEQNILVQNGQVAAVIDFGDICYVPRVFEVAIAVIYMMLLDTGDLDPVEEGPKFVLEGFLKYVKLERQELDVILVCATARLAQSLTLGAYSYTQQPGNEYLLTTQKKGWAVMERLVGVDQEKLMEKWLGEIEN